MLHFTYKFISVFVLQFYDPNLVVQFMYIKSAFDQQIEPVFTFHILSFKTLSDLPCKCICRHRQPPTLPKLKNCSPSIVRPHNRSPSIAVIVINHKLIVQCAKHKVGISAGHSPWCFMAYKIFLGRKVGISCNISINFLLW